MPEPRPPLTLAPPRIDDPSQVEKRACDRFYFHYSSLIRFTVQSSAQSGRAVLRDISAEGLGLLLKTWLEPGTMLVVDLPGLGGATQSQAAKVIHATPYVRGGWLIGCQFTSPLTNHDKARILQYSAEDCYSPQDDADVTPHDSHDEESLG
jgi:PilZ domain